MSRRQARVNDLLREVIAEIVTRELKDPRLDLPLLSITEVQVSADLRHARVHVSILASAEQQTEALQVLHRSSDYVRRQLRTRLAMKSIPQLHFVLDDRIAEGRRLHDFMDGIGSGEPASPERAP